MNTFLIDTNIFIYREGEKELSEDMILLSTLINDTTNFRFVIHPLSFSELKKIKDEDQKNTILSKFSTYKKLENPPRITQEFLEKYQVYNENDVIDASLLFALSRNCTNYFITNDKKIFSKAKLFNLEERVLTISDAIQFLDQDKVESNLSYPVYIKEDFLYNLQLDDHFFDSLRSSYFGFDDWFKRKQTEFAKAYVSYLDANNSYLGSFLMLKTEDESEDYSDFTPPLPRSKKLKISTFKVSDNGKLLGESYIRIIFDYLIEQNLNETYVTIFSEQSRLINLFLSYGFEYYGYKNTKKQDGHIQREEIYRWFYDKNETKYPFINYENQRVFIIPINEYYSKMLFPESIQNLQTDIFDHLGFNTLSHAIKKIYISSSKIKQIKENDIILFYFSSPYQFVDCIGVVENTFRTSTIDSIDILKQIVNRRTVFSDEDIQEMHKQDKLIISFKHYSTLPNKLSLNSLLKESIIQGVPQSIQQISSDSFKKIVELSKSSQVYFNRMEVLNYE